MMVIRPVVTFDQLYVGMQVHILDPSSKKLKRASITRLHVVKTDKFALDKFPKNSWHGGCDYSTYGGGVYASLRTYSEDGEPLEERCEKGYCIHVRYRNNVKAVVRLWSIRPINPLAQLAEQA